VTCLIAISKKSLFILYLFKIVLIFFSIDLVAASGETLSSLDRSALKDCFSGMNAIVGSKLQNDHVPKVLCAAKALNLSLVLSLPDVDKIFPLPGESLSLEDVLDCAGFAFDSRLQKEVVDAIREAMDNLSVSFQDSQLGNAFESARQCVANSSITNMEAYHQLANHYQGRGNLFDQFHAYVEGYPSGGK
jgi:hypothetical protein